MSEENEESAVSDDVAVLISLVAVDTDSVNTAKRLRLEIEGDAEDILIFTEANVRFLRRTSGEGFKMLVGATPLKIDPLAGDGPVAE